MEYEKHDCGGEIVDCEPSYIPLGKDSIMQIIDQRCKRCGALLIGNIKKPKSSKTRKRMINYMI